MDEAAFTAPATSVDGYSSVAGENERYTDPARGHVLLACFR